MKRLFLIIAIICSFLPWAAGAAPQTEQSPHTEQIAHHASESAHNSAMAPLFFVIIALAIGAATRHFLKKTPLPYTVLLMMLGLGIGTLSRLDILELLHLSYLNASVSWAGNIDPHVILFVFLPILVFEAAFAMDVHIFKNTLANATLLAVPGIVLAMFFTAGITMAISDFQWGLGGWNWEIAFMFGAVVSATDPVAVVSLLKELGASKKLGMLIEGESLLNDGTAIVLFMGFFLAMTGQATGNSALYDFVRVSAGGLTVGLVVAYVTIQWVKNVFNDAMVEITLIIASAYLCFFIAEHFFHVSGVLALVSFGLMMSGIGRTRISPEVEHFLHEFWELAAFIANTLIFIIVGVVIAQKTVFSATDFIVLAIMYIGIHIARIVMVAGHYPIMKNIGYGINMKDAAVLCWGGLRGAIALALALVVNGADSSYISDPVKHQFLFLTAGIVTLTLLINATTVGWLLTKLGMTAQTPAKALMLYNAEKYLLSSSENALERMKQDRFMGKANWKAVEELLPRPHPLQCDTGALAADTLWESRRMILEKEKSSYWKLFQSGLLGPISVQRLTGTIDEMLDKGGEIPLSSRKDLEEMWKTSKVLSHIQKIPVLGSIAKKLYFEQLTISYDSAKAFVSAQEESLKLLENMQRVTANEDAVNMKNMELLEDEINENKIQGQTFLRNLKKNLPEIYYAIATRQAMRSVLNHQRHTVERLYKNGQLGLADSEKMIADIEEKMKSLMNSPIAISELETKEFLKEIPILKDLSHEQFKHVVESSETLVFAVGDSLIKADTHSDSIMLITRGTVKVRYHSEIVAVLGPGSIIGEIAMLTGYDHNATVVAESPVTVLKINYLQVNELMSLSKNLSDELWRIAGNRIARDMLKDMQPFAGWDEKFFDKWCKQGQIILHTQPDTVYQLNNQIGVLLSGCAYMDNFSHTKLSAPTIIDSISITLDKNSYLFINTMPSEAGLNK